MTSNEPSDEKQMEQLKAVREIIDRHGFPSGFHRFPAGAISLIVYPQMEEARRLAGFQGTINRLAGYDVGFWTSYHDQQHVFKITCQGNGKLQEFTTAEDAAKYVIDRLAEDGDDKIPVIDKLPNGERKSISWAYPTGTGTERFAVWNEGTGRITLYHPEGIELEHYDHPTAEKIAEYGIKNIRTLNDVQARRICRQLWGKPAYEKHRDRTYV